MGTNKGLIHWRQQRHALQQLLQRALTGSLCGIRRSELGTCIDELCSRLIDYISIGHRRFYSSPPAQHGAAGRAAPWHELQRQIGDTTDTILAFNRKYETSSLCAASAALYSDLLKLHRQLSLRFTLEEQWVELQRIELRSPRRAPQRLASTPQVQLRQRTQPTERAY